VSILTVTDAVLGVLAMKQLPLTAVIQLRERCRPASRLRSCSGMLPIGHIPRCRSCTMCPRPRFLGDIAFFRRRSIERSPNRGNVALRHLAANRYMRPTSRDQTWSRCLKFRPLQAEFRELLASG